MSATLERKLDKIENLLKQLLAERTKEWINEDEAMAILNRGKCWLKMARNGVGEKPAYLIEGKDWKKINGRTPKYKFKSIENLEKLLTIKK